MSYDDTGDNRLVTIRLHEVRRIRDALASIRQENSLNDALWRQVAGLYQRLRAQPGTLATTTTQGSKE